MRELEFLPTWYGQLQSRRRMVVLQVWALLALAGGIALWMFLIDRNRRVAERSLEALRGQLVQTDSQLQQMERLEQLRRQWRQKAEVLAKLGLHVQSARLIAKLNEALRARSRWSTSASRPRNCPGSSPAPPRRR